jgi:tetratricopeptide (TPR) repeat protein
MLSEYYPIWMAIGDGFRARRLADRARERYRTSDWAAAEAEVTAAPARLAAEAWAQLGVALENAERTEDARRALLRSRALAPGRTDTLLFLAELEADAGNHEVAIGLFRELLAAAPRAANQALDLARLLAATGRANAPDEIIEVLEPFAKQTSIELRLTLARALFAAARYADVLAVVGAVIKDAELELGSLAARSLRAELIDHGGRSAPDVARDGTEDDARADAPIGMGGKHA